MKNIESESHQDSIFQRKIPVKHLVHRTPWSLLGIPLNLEETIDYSYIIS